MTPDRIMFGLVGRLYYSKKKESKVKLNAYIVALATYDVMGGETTTVLPSSASVKLQNGSDKVQVH